MDSIIVFTGEWDFDERARVRRLVRETDDFLDAHMSQPWTFVKTETGFSVKQPSLLEKPFMAAALLTICEHVRRVAVVTAPWVTYGE